MLKNILLLIFLIVCLKNENVESAKILGIFPWPSKSHQILGNTLLKELAERGHNVTVIGHFPVEDAPENFHTVRLTKFLDYIKQFEGRGNFWTNPNSTVWYKWYSIISNMSGIYPLVFEDENLQNFLKRNEKFDICMTILQFTESYLGICNHVNASVIGFSTIGMNTHLAYHTRNPTPYSYVANPLLPFATNMDFKGRFFNTIAWNAFDFILKFIFLPMHQNLLTKYFPEAPPLSDLLDNVNLYLANTHFATDTPTPLLPNIIPIGGFHLSKKQHLPEDIKEFLDNSTQGVIYFNLGTNAKSSDLDADTLQMFIESFKKTPMNVLWKFEKPLKGLPKNVKTAQWMPQLAVLEHPNVKVFITHSGLGGTVEAIYHGVPMICLPFFSDQSKNAATSVQEGYAISFDIKKLTVEKLTNALVEITSNPKYKEAISLKSDLYKNQEMDPMDRAVFWVEHVARHKGAKHLQTVANKLPYYQYMLFDVVGVLIGVSVLTLLIGYFVLKLSFKAVKCCFRLVFCWGKRIAETKIKVN